MCAVSKVPTLQNLLKPLLENSRQDLFFSMPMLKELSFSQSNAVIFDLSLNGTCHSQSIAVGGFKFPLVVFLAS